MNDPPGGNLFKSDLSSDTRRVSLGGKRQNYDSLAKGITILLGKYLRIETRWIKYIIQYIHNT